MSQEPYIMIFIYGTHVEKDIISWCYLCFSKF